MLNFAITICYRRSNKQILKNNNIIDLIAKKKKLSFISSYPLIIEVIND